MAAAEGLEVMAKIVSYASGGVDPSIMGTGPIPASHLALEKARHDSNPIPNPNPNPNPTRGRMDCE